MNLFIYETMIGDSPRHLISVIEPEKVFADGLKPKSIIGQLRSKEHAIVPENIAFNPAFIALFQETIPQAALQSKDLHEEAAHQLDGMVFIIDHRAKTNPGSKPQDIIGAFQVVSGNIVPENYRPNPNYQIISDDGIFQLPRALEEALMQAILS